MVNLMDKKCGAIHGTGVVVQSEAGIADAKTVRSPVSGLNRKIIPVDKSLLEPLEKPGASHKSLRDRICGLWLIRKIVGLFQRVFVCSRKNIDPDSGEAARSEDAVAVKAMSNHQFRIIKCVAESMLLLRSVHVLGQMIGMQDFASANWAVVSASFDRIKTSLNQLEDDMSYIDPCQSQFDNVKDRKRLEQLNSRKEEIDMYLSWIEFYIKDSRVDGYYNCNMRYYDATLTHMYDAAKKALSDKKSLLDKLDTLYQTARSSAEKKVKYSHAYDAVDDVNKFKTGILALVDSVNRRNKYQREFSRSLPEKWTPKTGQHDKCLLGSSRHPGSRFE